MRIEDCGCALISYVPLQLDLGEERVVTEVTVVNRMDCCGKRLRRLKVHVGNE